MKRIFNTKLNTSAIHVCLFLLRIGVGAFMLTHGIPKLMKVIAGDFTFRDPLGMGGGISLVLTMLAEVGCSILILIGAGTRLAALPLTFAMLVAAFIAHGSDPFTKKETALMYLLLYIILLITGSGKYSVDGLMSRKHPQKSKVLQ